MQIVIVQLDIAWEDPAANYAKVRQLLRDGLDLPQEFTRPEVADVLRKAFAAADETAANVNASTDRIVRPPQTETDRIVPETQELVDA